MVVAGSSIPLPSTPSPSPPPPTPPLPSPPPLVQLISGLRLRMCAHCKSDDVPPKPCPGHISPPFLCSPVEELEAGKKGIDIFRESKSLVRKDTLRDVPGLTIAVVRRWSTGWTIDSLWASWSSLSTAYFSQASKPTFSIVFSDPRIFRSLNNSFSRPIQLISNTSWF